MLFNDFLLEIQCNGHSARISFVKPATEDAAAGGFPAIARRMGDAWLNERQVQRRLTPRSDPKGALLIERLRDLVALAPFGPPGNIHAERGIDRGDEGAVALSVEAPSSVGRFILDAAKHAIGVAGAAFNWTPRDSSRSLRFASGWSRTPLAYSVARPGDPPSNAIRLALSRRAQALAAVRTRSWLKATGAPGELIEGASHLHPSTAD